MTQTKYPLPQSLPARALIEKILAENVHCPESFRGQKCGKPVISHDVAFSFGRWVVFCTCEEGHTKPVPIQEPDDSRTNVGP